MNGQSTLSQPAFATCNSREGSINWKAIDAEFRSIIAPVATDMAAGYLSTAEAGDTLSFLVKVHLIHHEVIVSDDLSINYSRDLMKRTRRIEIVTEDLRKRKNISRKILKDQPHTFHQLFRSYHASKKACTSLSFDREMRKLMKRISKPTHGTIPNTYLPKHLKVQPSPVHKMRLLLISLT